MVYSIIIDIPPSAPCAGSLISPRLVASSYKCTSKVKTTGICAAGNGSWTATFGLHDLTQVELSSMSPSFAKHR